MHRTIRTCIGVGLMGVILGAGAQPVWADTPTAKYCAAENELKITAPEAREALGVHPPSPLPGEITLKFEVEGTAVFAFKQDLSQRGNSQGRGNQGDGTNIILIGSTSSSTTTYENVELQGGGVGGIYKFNIDLDELVGDSDAAPRGPNPRSGFEPIGAVDIGDNTQIHLYILKGEDEWVLMNIVADCS